MQISVRQIENIESSAKAINCRPGGTFSLIAPIFLSAAKVFAQETLSYTSQENNPNPAKKTYPTYPYDVNGGTQIPGPYANSGGLVGKGQDTSVLRDLQTTGQQVPTPTLPTTMLQQAVEQNKALGPILSGLQSGDHYLMPNDTYNGIKLFWIGRCW